jgi:hypothetical protein
MKRAFLLAVGLLASACSGPDAPSLAQVAGNWTGSFAFTQDTGPNILGVVAQMGQSGSAVTGTWAVGAVNWSGQINGTVDASSFTGTFTITQPGQLGLCNGTASITGLAGGQTLTWHGLGFTGNCNNMPTSLTWSLQRQ